MRFVNDLDHRRETVGRARRRRQQPVLCRVIAILVDADDDIQRRRVLDRRRDDDAAHASVEVTLQLIRLQKFPGAFQDDVAAEIAPRHLARQARGAEADAPIADDDRLIVFGGELLAPAAVQAVEFKKVRGDRGAAFDLVDVNNVQPIACARIVRRADPSRRATRAGQAGRCGPCH